MALPTWAANITATDVVLTLVGLYWGIKKFWKTFMEGRSSEQRKLDEAVAEKTKELRAAHDDQARALAAKSEYIAELEREREDLQRQLSVAGRKAMEQRGEIDALERRMDNLELGSKRKS